MDAKLASLPKNRYSAATPEQIQEFIRQFRALPSNRQAAIKQLLNRSCPYCEREFGTGNVGANHSLCARHRQEIYAQMGKPAPASTNALAQDLKDFSPEELKIAAYFTALIYAKDRKAWKPV